MTLGQGAIRRHGRGMGKVTEKIMRRLRGRRCYRAEFFAVQGQVRELMSQGYDRKSIHVALCKGGSLSCSYPTFLRLVRRYLAGSVEDPGE